MILKKTCVHSKIYFCIQCAGFDVEGETAQLELSTSSIIFSYFCWNDIEALQGGAPHLWIGYKPHQI